MNFRWRRRKGEETSRSNTVEGPPFLCLSSRLRHGTGAQGWLEAALFDSSIVSLNRFSLAKKMEIGITCDFDEADHPSKRKRRSLRLLVSGH
ncbi:uncharacterized protein G2W53_007803 [Senna tora]|uniref:Uncharacterized protein n=1 Tax=Senna tora TaxID=362788 RepID=A0A835CE17_9FABA|nr:uncharacterized protein G2W53_007803 [Senna tora]